MLVEAWITGLHVRDGKSEDCLRKPRTPRSPGVFTAIGFVDDDRDSFEADVHVSQGYVAKNRGSSLPPGYDGTELRFLSPLVHTEPLAGTQHNPRSAALDQATIDG